MTGHLRLDLDRVKYLESKLIEPSQFSTSVCDATNLSIVNSNDRTDHLGHDNHVTQMCFHDSRLLVGGCLLLGFAELLDKSHRTALKSTLEAAAGTGMNELR